MPSFQPFLIGFPKQIKIYSFETEWTGSQPKKPPNGLANPTYKPHLDKLDPGFKHIIGEVAPPSKLKTAHDDLGDSIFASITSDEDPLTNPDHVFGLDVGPVNQTADIWTNGGASTVKPDALVQQVNGTIGYAMQAGIGSEHWQGPAAEMFATGSAVDSWIEKTFGNGDGEMLGGISQGNVFAPVNVLRSDNRF